MKTIDYYRCLFGPFLEVLHRNIHISYSGSNLQIALINMNLPFDEVKYVGRKKKRG
jgi:hypothetical protein